MATGPEHYREAEYRLDQALINEGGSNAERYNLASAQIHATLALAAATALASTGVGEADLGEWTALICAPEPTDTEAYAEAFVDVADAERYAQRDEYVNSGDPDAEAEAAQEAWAEQRERAVDEALDARDAEGSSLGSTWADPAVRAAVRETIAESGS